MNSDEFIELNIWLMSNAFVNVQGTVARQTIGIPTELSCCVMLCDLWLHHFERGWVQRFIAQHKYTLVKRYTSHIFRIMDDLGGDIGGREGHKDFLHIVDPYGTGISKDEMLNVVGSEDSVD